MFPVKAIPPVNMVPLLNILTVVSLVSSGQRIPKSIVDPVIPSRPKDLSINPDMETFKKSISELKRKKALNPKPSQIKDVSVKPDMDFKGRVSPVETAEELNVFDLAKALGKKKGDPLTRDDIKKIIAASLIT